MKKTALALILALSLAFVFASLPQIGLVKADSIIYIRENGSVDGTNLIERHDNTYTFLNNISGSIIVSKDFITIDGSGFTLIGTDDSSQKGISLSNRKNVTVSNMTIMNYFIGISCVGTASNITILNNNISRCGIGIEFLGSSNNLVKYNTFKNNDIDITVNYVSENVIFITQNSLNDYVQVWMSEPQTIDMNYWADYNGTDANGDGIGDSPYFYKDILQDNHPLMEPLVIPGQIHSPSPSFIPKPAIPEFTVRLTSSFPEENTTTLELKIKNQPFDKDNIYHYSFFYNVGTRTDDGNWTTLYNAEDGYPSQSDSDYTVLSFASSINNSDGWFKSTAYTYPYHWIYAPSGAKLDIQVEAMIGYRTRSWEPPILPYVFTGEKSGWSDTQTITISDPSVPSPSPTSTSFSPDSSLVIVIVVVSVAVVSIVSLVYFKKRRGEAKLS